MGICRICECGGEDGICHECLEEWWEKSSDTKQLRADLAELRTENARLREALRKIDEQGPTERYGTNNVELLLKWVRAVRTEAAAALKPADTIVTATAGLIEAGQKVTREAAEAEKDSEP